MPPYDAPNPEVLLGEGVLDGGGEEADGATGDAALDAGFDGVPGMVDFLLLLDLDGMWVRHILFALFFLSRSLFCLERDDGWLIYVQARAFVVRRGSEEKWVRPGRFTVDGWTNQALGDISSSGLT